MNHAQIAGDRFLEGYNCAQSVAMAFSDVTGLTPEATARMVSAFGGGVARMREVCGAVSGMAFVLGVLYGYDRPDDNAGKRALYQLTQSLAERFRAEHGSIVCREILKNPPADPNPTPRTEQFYHARPCARLVMSAAALLDEYIQERPPV